MLRGARGLLNRPLVQTVKILSPHTARLTARRRSRARAGFTLIELMVVVVLVAILAVIATPAMRTSRDDRQAFDYARQTQQMMHRARTLSAGTGGAHLIIAAPGAGRGHVYLFEGLDSAAPPNGPNPWPSCKLTNNAVPVAAWAAVPGWVPGAASTPDTNIVDGLDLDTLGVNVDANILTQFRLGTTAGTAVVPTLAICITGNGTTYAGSGPNVAAAIANMQAQPPFTGAGEIIISRNNVLNVPVGLQRHVVFGAGSAPRILSK